MLKAKGVFIVFFSAVFCVGTTLDCYRCSTSVVSSCVATTSCAAGQVCSKEVFRRYFLNTIYEKGCMTRSRCQSLANLNDDRYCSVAPSTCTYCCDSNLCNGSNTNVKNHMLNGHFIVFVLAIYTISFFIS